VLVADTATATLSANTIAEQDVGIQVGGTAVVETDATTISTSAVAAVGYGETSTGTVRGSSVDAAAGVGIEITGSAQVTVDANTVTGAGDAGLSVSESAQATETGNVVTGRNVGIQVGGSARADISGANVRDSALIGVLFADQSSAAWREARSSPAPPSASSPVARRPRRSGTAR